MAKLTSPDVGYRMRPCRAAVLPAVDRLERGSRRRVFHYDEVVNEVLRVTADWPPSTIATSVQSIMCVASPACRFPDLDRVERGR